MIKLTLGTVKDYINQETPPITEEELVIWNKFWDDLTYEEQRSYKKEYYTKFRAALRILAAENEAKNV